MFYGDFSGDTRAKFQAALAHLRTMFKRVYAQDNLIAVNRNLSFLHEQKFKAAFERHAGSQQEKSLLWRIHTLAWAARHCATLPGDFVECGVWRGFSFSVLTDYLDFETLDTTLYLYDTYEGIPPAYNSENRSNCVYEQFMRQRDHWILELPTGQGLLLKR